jgi:hypothetical protein
MLGVVLALLGLIELIDQIDPPLRYGLARMPIVLDAELPADVVQNE